MRGSTRSTRQMEPPQEVELSPRTEVDARAHNGGGESGGGESDEGQKTVFTEDEPTTTTTTTTSAMSPTSLGTKKNTFRAGSVHAGDIFKSASPPSRGRNT